MANCTVKKLADSVVNASLPILEEPLAIIDISTFPTSTVVEELNVGDKSGLRVYFDGFDISQFSVGTGRGNFNFYTRDTTGSSSTGGSAQINDILDSNKSTKLGTLLTEGIHINGSSTANNTGQFRWVATNNDGDFSYTGAAFKIVIYKEADA